MLIRASSIAMSVGLALALAAPHAHANSQAAPARPLTIGPGFAPNPTVVRNINPGKKTMSYRKLGADSRNGCSGYTTAAPMLTFNLTKPMKSNLVLRAYGGDLDTVIVFFPGRKYVCKTSRVIGPIEVRMREWPAGEIKVWLTGRIRTRAYKYNIELEDTSRGESFDKNIKTRTISKNPAKPIMISGRVKSDLGPPSYKLRKAAWRDCRKARWSRQPDFFLEIDRPLKNMDFRLLFPTAKVRVRMVKLPEKGKRPRNIFGACKNDGRLHYKTMDDGKYAVYVGGVAGAQGQPYNLVITGKDTVVDRLALAPRIPAKPAMWARSVWFHFPFLTRDDWRGGHQRDLLEHGLFMKAPKQLFAYIKFDMDEASAQSQFGAYSSKKKSIRYPKANEPVLVLNGGGNRPKVRVMTADGDTYLIKEKHLLDAPRGKVVLPKRVRHTDQNASTALTYAAPADKKYTKRHYALSKRVNDCMDRRWRPYQRQIDALRRGPWSKHRAMRIASVKRRGNNAVDRACKPQRIYKSKERLRKILIKTRTKRRNKALAQVRKRFGV